MADYIYLLENRLSAAQRSALGHVRDVARAKGLTTFLVGGAVRDLTSGSPVRDLDVVVQGSAPKLRRDLEKAGGVLTGEHEGTQSLFLRFPGGVRLDVGSTLSLHFPKPGKPVARPASLLEDLRRRDFTANAMALSLNDGSYGLLMDPLNGVADIENRELRLVSNYGFIEDPVRMIRAARLMARLGWTMDEKTQARYETGKAEGYIGALSSFHRGYETEEIFHEEDPLRVLRRLEAEGWMAVLAPFWTAAKVNTVELERLRETQTMLQMQGLQPDSAAASFPLLTAKLSAKEIAALKASFPRQGFVAEIEALDATAKEVATQLAGKEAAAPSGAWRLLFTAPPEAVLAVAFSSKNPAIQAKLKSFATEWPQARTRMPYLLMQEMRIVPELPGYDDLLEKIFFELIDGRLTTPEETRAFLEPFSPPAPPPPVNLRRLRAPKKESKPSKAKAKKPTEEDASASEEQAESSEAQAQDPVPVTRDGTAARELTASEHVPGEAKTAAALEPAPAKAAVKAVAPSPSPAKSAPARSGSSPGPETAKAAPPAPGADGPARSSQRPETKTVPPAKQRPSEAAKSAAKPVPDAAAAKGFPAPLHATEKAARPAPATGRGAAPAGKRQPVKGAEGSSGNGSKPPVLKSKPPGGSARRSGDAPKASRGAKLAKPLAIAAAARPTKSSSERVKSKRAVPVAGKLASGVRRAVPASAGSSKAPRTQPKPPVGKQPKPAGVRTKASRAAAAAVRPAAKGGRAGSPPARPNSVRAGASRIREGSVAVPSRRASGRTVAGTGTKRAARRSR